MTKPAKLSAAQEEIVRAQNDALLRLPAKVEDRIRIVAEYRMRLAREKDAVKEAKEEIDAAGSLKALTSTYGYTKQAVKLINIVEAMANPAERAATIRQAFNHFDDKGYIYRDLFDEGAIGVGSNDVAGETAGFDATSEGQRRDGDTAQPRTVEEMAATHTPAPTPAVPLDEAERRLEEYRAANPPKRGAKPKELKALEAAVAAAREAQDGAGEAEGTEIPELPEAAPGEITGALREGNAESEEHIREQVAGPSALPAEGPAPEKPKRGRKPKSEPAAPPPPAEDEEDDTIPVGPPVHRPDALGAAPSTYRVG